MSPGVITHLPRWICRAFDWLAPNADRELAAARERAKEAKR